MGILLDVKIKGKYNSKGVKEGLFTFESHNTTGTFFYDGIPFIDPLFGGLSSNPIGRFERYYRWEYRTEIGFMTKGVVDGEFISYI